MQTMLLNTSAPTAGMQVLLSIVSVPADISISDIALSAVSLTDNDTSGSAVALSDQTFYVAAMGDDINI